MVTTHLPGRLYALRSRPCRQRSRFRAASLTHKKKTPTKKKDWNTQEAASECEREMIILCFCQSSSPCEREKKRDLVFLSLRKRESAPRGKKSVKFWEAAREGRWDVRTNSEAFGNLPRCRNKWPGWPHSHRNRTRNPFRRQCRGFCAASAKYRRDAHEEDGPEER
jgi:hypothetical protein